MEYNFASVIGALNEVNDNIWLGDLRKAVEIAELSLEKAKKDETFSAQETANKVKSILKQVRKDAREKNAINRRLWVAEQVSLAVKEGQINPVENLYGVLLRNLSDLKEAIDFLIKIKSQTTLINYREEKTEDSFEVQKAEGYRYIVQRHPQNWDVRAILDRSPSKWYIEELKKSLFSFGFQISELYDDKSSRTFELYSNDMYAQVLSHENRVEMTIFTIETQESRQKIGKILETILAAQK